MKREFFKFFRLGRPIFGNDNEGRVDGTQSRAVCSVVLLFLARFGRLFFVAFYFVYTCLFAFAFLSAFTFDLALALLFLVFVFCFC